MKLKYICLVIFINTVMLPARAAALTYPGAVEGVGDQVLSVSARSASMGNTAVSSISGAEAQFYNPAGMFGAYGGELVLGLGVYPVKEIIEDSSEPTNYNSAAYYELSSAGISVPVANLLVVGVGRRPVLNLDYDHNRKVYSSGEVTSVRDYDRSGGVNETGVAVAFGIVPGLNVGAGYGALSGILSSQESRLEVEKQKDVVEEEAEYSGSRFNLGMSCQMVRDVVTVGFNWRPAFTAEKKWDTDTKTYDWSGSWPESPSTLVSSEGTVEYRFADEYGLGMTYEFWERERAVMTVDLVRTMWEDFRYKETENRSSALYDISQNPGYRSVTRVSVGVEHFLGLETVLRYGFTHLPHYTRSSADTTMITFGIGFPLLESVTVDTAAVYGKRSFIGDNVFFTEDEAVDERIAKLMVSAKLKF